MRNETTPQDGEHGSTPVKLGRPLEEALRCLEGTDLHGANAALERARTEAASPRKDAGAAGYVGADEA